MNRLGGYGIAKEGGRKEGRRVVAVSGSDDVHFAVDFPLTVTIF